MKGNPVSDEAAVIALETIRTKAKELEAALTRFKAQHPAANDWLVDIEPEWEAL